MNKLDDTFSALGDSTRRSILQRLAQGKVSLSELAEPFDMSQTAVSKHVRILGDAGLVTVEKLGRTRYCSLNAAPLKSANDWLSDYEQFWTGQFENLAQFLASEKST